MITWNYNGSTTLAIVATGLTPSGWYRVKGGYDADSAPFQAQADGAGALSTSLTGIGDPAGVDGDLGAMLHLFAVEVVEVTDSIATDQIEETACNIFTFGVASTTGTPSGAVWTFDGTTGVGVGYPSDVALEYRIRVFYSATAWNGEQNGSWQAGTGGTDSRTLTLSGTADPVQAYAVLEAREPASADPSWVFQVSNALFTGGSTALVRGDPASALPAPVEGRVLIAFDDTPLEPDPVWTRIDDTDNLVASYDITTGKQTELDRTDTGTATVFLNDTAGLFDPLNTGSPYFGKIVGKQILLQLWNPVTSEWVQEWRGKIRNYNYAVNPVLGADGKPIVVHVQVDCVDIFDYLGAYGLQPGVNGDTPPSGQEGIVFYEDTVGTVDDRIIQALTDAGIDSTRWVVFSGNVKVQEWKYDPGDAMLNVLRDAADAEFPGLANIYVDRFGRFVFHGRYARFDPEGVIAAGPVSTDTWDFHRWKVGDGTAITGDSDYAQIRVLGYTHGEDDIVNSAISWPAGMVDTDMPGQVFEDGTTTPPTGSIGAHGKHSLPPMGDLLISECPTTMNTPKVECQKFAEFFVHYLKDPQTRITDLMVKAIGPDDPRAASTWDVICKADISDIMRTTVGYPGGTGIDSDNYIEGYTKRVRPLNPTHDYVEVEFNLTPTAWALDPDGILAPAS